MDKSNQEAPSTGLEHVESKADGQGGFEVSGREWAVVSFGERRIMDGRMYADFVKGAERLVRTSPAYSRYLGWLRGTQGLDRCSVMPAVNDENAVLEFHHFPLTLYDLCSASAERQFHENGLANTFSVADEVLGLHYQNKACVLPLSKTAHQLAHSGELVLDVSQAFGRLEEYLREYAPHLEDSVREKLKRMAEAQGSGFSAAALEVSDSGRFDIPKLEAVP